MPGTTAITRSQKAPTCGISGWVEPSGLLSHEGAACRLDPRHTVVHLHGWTKALSASPIAAAEKLGFKTVCTLHDFFTACPNGGFFDYVTNTPCTRVALSMDCVTARCDKRHHAHKLFRVARSYTWREFGRLPASVHHFIALSKQSVEQLRPYLPPQAQFHWLRNVINIAKKPPVNVAANSTVVCVGRLDQEKGVTLLAEAARDLGLPIKFVGDGPLRAALEAIPGMAVTGWLAAEQVVQEIEKASILVFPSRWHETYGLVVEEAAARGVAAIVSDVSAPSERIEQGVTGWHFESGSKTGLQHALTQALTGDAAASAGMAAYERYWIDAPTPSAHVERLKALYNTVLSGS